MKIQERVVAAIRTILTDRGKPVKWWDDGDGLVHGIGLDSLDLAVLVVTLEIELGVDPFRDGRTNVRTLGDLVRVYETAAGTRV